MTISELEGYFTKEQIEQAIHTIKHQGSVMTGLIGTILVSGITFSIVLFGNYGLIWNLTSLAVSSGFSMKIFGNGSSIIYAGIGAGIFLIFAFSLSALISEMSFSQTALIMVYSVGVGWLSMTHITGDRILRELHRS